MSPLSNAGVFLISTLFGLYILAIMLRLILQIVRADFYNPVSRFIVKITNPPLKPYVDLFLDLPALICPQSLS